VRILWRSTPPVRVRDEGLRRASERGPSIRRPSSGLWKAGARRVRDPGGVGLNGTLHPVKLRVAYHDACHLAHGQRVRSQPRTILARSPGLRSCRSRSPTSAVQRRHLQSAAPGTLAGVPGAQAGRLAETGAQVVVAGNPGCLLQIAAGLRERACPCAPPTPSKSSIGPTGASPCRRSETHNDSARLVGRSCASSPPGT